MMRVLLVKTSSMGDIIHALPALTDAMRAIPGIRFDWVVEEAFQEIPAWHPAVDRVIPVALRRWRKNPLKIIFSGCWRRFKNDLQKESYDLVLDSQGLIKSAWLTTKAKGMRVGYDKKSARESLASWFFQKRISVKQEQHAIIRQRMFFAGALGYSVPNTDPDSALTLKWTPEEAHPYVFFLHGTSWHSKEWPEENWIELAKLAIKDGYQVKVTWGNQREKERAERIALAVNGVVIPRTDLNVVMNELAGATRVIGVDSGLGHLVAALKVPAIGIYGATDVSRTGALGPKQENLVGDARCAPCNKRVCNHIDLGGQQMCMKNLDAAYVWSKAMEIVIQ